jgi:hypothetical protein
MPFDFDEAAKALARVRERSISVSTRTLDELCLHVAGALTELRAADALAEARRLQLVEKDAVVARLEADLRTEQRSLADLAQATQAQLTQLHQVVDRAMRERRRLAEGLDQIAQMPWYVAWWRAARTAQEVRYG